MSDTLKPVWVWLPGQVQPTQCGEFELQGQVGRLLHALDDAAQRRHVGEVAPDRHPHVAGPGNQVVGRVEMDPAGSLAAPYGHPGVTRVGAAQRDLVAGRQDREALTAH